MADDIQRLGRAAPRIPVSDMGAATALYGQAFGLEVSFAQGEPPTCVVLPRPAARRPVVRNA